MRPPDLPGGNVWRDVILTKRIRASMRPPDLPGGNQGGIRDGRNTQCRASMRPPDLPGGNDRRLRRARAEGRASMRPPDLPGGNLSDAETSGNRIASMRPPDLRRKLYQVERWTERLSHRFNEAAGFTRRKLVGTTATDCQYPIASMRPPDLPGGNNVLSIWTCDKPSACFNEAAGFTRRKRIVTAHAERQHGASMRPPDLPGGNS